MNPQDYDLSSYSNSNSYQSYYHSSFDSQSIPCYYDEALYMNDDEILYDEELISTLQDLSNDERIRQDNIYESPFQQMNLQQPKKRRSAEAIARINQRRRAHAFPRILKRDIRREYMNYYVNVMNSADLTLTLKYLNRYYHPNVILAKLDLNNSTTLKIQGRDVLTHLFVSRINDMPDHTINISNTKLKVDPKTNHSLIQSDFVIQATKVKSTLSHLEALVQRMHDIIEGKELCHSFFIRDGNETKEDEKEDDESTTVINTKELTQNDFFYHHISVSNNQSAQLNEQLKEFASSYHSIYQKNIDDFKTKQIETNALSCATNQSDPILCLNPPIKSSFEGSISMYLDESYMISHIETQISALAFEPLLV